MPFLEVLSFAGYIVFMYMVCWFVIGTILRRNDVADVAWGIGFMVVAMCTFAAGVQSHRALLVTCLVLVWGSRLAYHISRRLLSHPEDKRYAAWRAAWGKYVIPRAFLQVYMLQGLLLVLIAVPVITTNAFGDATLGALDILGIAVWLFGFFFEVVGDRQLRAFIKNPENKGKILTTGLWKYTRHPNYFGEVTQWWGIWLIALSVPYGFLAIVGPLTITFLILKVSGIPMLEKSFEGRPEFEAYKLKTNAFIPWLPKK